MPKHCLNRWSPASQDRNQGTVYVIRARCTGYAAKVQQAGCGVQVDEVERRLTNVHGEAVKDVLA